MKLVLLCILTLLHLAVFGQNRNTMYAEAERTYNLAVQYGDKRYYDSAIARYKRLIQTSFTDDDDIETVRMIGPIGNMYKNRACLNLYNIYCKTRNFDSALKYVYMADTLFWYNSGCGEASDYNRMMMYTYYSKCYEGLGMVDKAIDVVIGEIFNDEWGDVAAVQRLKEVIVLKYTPQQVKTEVQKATDNISVFREKEGMYAVVHLLGYWMCIGYFMEDEQDIYVGGGKISPDFLNKAKPVTDTMKLRIAKERYLSSKTYRELSAIN